MPRDLHKEMHFDDEQAMILKSAREFCKKKSPISVVRELIETDNGFDGAAWNEMAELGWLGAGIPETYGGFDLGIGGVVPIAESMGRFMLSTPFISTTLAGQALLRAGTEGQKREWLPKIADGSIATVAFVESEDWGNDVLTCTTDEDGGRLVLKGSKWFVADAGAAEIFIVPVSHRGRTEMAIVNCSDLQTDAMHRHLLIDETKRAFRIDFSGAVLDKSALLDSGKSEAALRDLKLIGALLVAAEAVGSAAAALDLTVDYLKNRKQFGRYIGSYQALKHPTVDVLNEMEGARSLVYHAATILGDDPLDPDMEIACRMAKAQATEALLFAGDRAVQFHGGMGFTYECDAQLYIRRAQWAQQQFGDAYHHRKRLAPLLLDD